MRIPWRRRRTDDNRRRYQGVHRLGAVRDGQHTATPTTSPCRRMSAWLDTAPLDVQALRRLHDPRPRHADEGDLVTSVVADGGDGGCAV